ncbi:hypothetical protein CC80DRAFT_199736 [Byssothecium circinans]|uniref:Uncharacterized protein n=1 Tax=Byssothecium circinans TaxID=147558 RepID=A0A6A5UG55_9PLEO|nr:hypothetical protein CC80DRAFT_199736 [Byssothecium circinans]
MKSHTRNATSVNCSIHSTYGPQISSPAVLMHNHTPPIKATGLCVNFGFNAPEQKCRDIITGPMIRSLSRASKTETPSPNNSTNQRRPTKTKQSDQSPRTTPIPQPFPAPQSQEGRETG